MDYGFQYSVRFDLLYRAFLRGWERDADAVREFRNANPWVEDYALYMALKRSQDMRSWETWPEEIRLRRPGAAETYAVRLGDDVHFFIYLQYLFFGQWDVYSRTARVSIVRWNLKEAVSKSLVRRTEIT